MDRRLQSIALSALLVRLADRAGLLGGPAREVVDDEGLRSACEDYIEARHALLCCASAPDKQVYVDQYLELVLGLENDIVTLLRSGREAA